MWLTRNRKRESEAKDNLPENVKQFREFEMEDKIQDLLEDPKAIHLGFRNGWSSWTEEFYYAMVENGVKFTRVRRPGYWLYFNEEHKATFKVDSGD